MCLRERERERERVGMQCLFADETVKTCTSYETAPKCMYQYVFRLNACSCLHAHVRISTELMMCMYVCM